MSLRNFLLSPNRGAAYTVLAMSGPVWITATIVFAVTAAVWAYALTQHTFLMREFWLYAAIFLAPGLAVCFSLWVILRRHPALKVLGGLSMVASLFVWGVALLLVFVGFKIH